ncbi:MAG: hypothetical protein EOO25_03250 [Comamonadaceae bacterium]|nr:MAG: hypothetical protein EOO25_03250 [Comamonadaceae bacterium]
MLNLDPVIHGLAGNGWHRLGPALALLAALWGCALPAQPLPEPPPPLPPAPVVVAPAADPAPAPVVVVPLPPMATADELLAYAESARALPAPELAQEITRLGEPGESAPRLMRLAIALGVARGNVNSARAQVLLQRVLAQNTAEAQALHPLARLLLAQQAELRRSDEQLERQAQQLRDAQRRIEQLNDRLEAVRAIERSLPSRPASAPGNGQRP